MSTTQAIVRRTTTDSYTFVTKPPEETRKKLVAAGFQFNAKSGQWYRFNEESDVVTEEAVEQQLAA